MPKKGYVAVTLKKEVAELVRGQAKVSGMCLNDYLLSLTASERLALRRPRVQIPPGPLCTATSATVFFYV